MLLTKWTPRQLTYGELLPATLSVDMGSCPYRWGVRLIGGGSPISLWQELESVSMHVDDEGTVFHAADVTFSGPFWGSVITGYELHLDTFYTGVENFMFTGKVVLSSGDDITMRWDSRGVWRISATTA